MEIDVDNGLMEDNVHYSSHDVEKTNHVMSEDILEMVCSYLFRYDFMCFCPFIILLLSYYFLAKTNTIFNVPLCWFLVIVLQIIRSVEKSQRRKSSSRKKRKVACLLCLYIFTISNTNVPDTHIFSLYLALV
jgi:hypothetical protein